MSYILNEAADKVKEATEKYGGQLEGFAMTAQLWTAILGVPVTPNHVVLCFLANKLSREVQSHNLDNLIDIAGYAAAYDALLDEQARLVRVRAGFATMTVAELNELSFMDKSKAIRESAQNEILRRATGV